MVRNRYDNTLRYIDLQVGLFIKFLKEHNFYDNFIIFVIPHVEYSLQEGYSTAAALNKKVAKKCSGLPLGQGFKKAVIVSYVEGPTEEVVVAFS